MFELLFTHPSWAYRTGTFAFASAWPLWLLATSILVALAAIAATLWRQRALGWRRLLAVGALQACFVALLACMLWRPVLNVERVRDRENVLAIALDASASMAYGEAQQSRLQLAAAALSGGPLAALETVFDVQLYGFAGEAVPLDNLAAVPPPGSQTRIGAALEQVLQGAGSVPLAAVVLIGDGAENGGTLDEESLARIAAYGVPVHTVGVGPERIQNDLELERVDVPSSAPSGSTVSAYLGIRHDGAQRTRLRVYDRDTLLATQELALDDRSELASVTVDVPAGDSGTRELRFVLDPLAGEANVVNNTRTRIVTVPAERRHILYVEGEPRWEYKFLRRAADRERALRVASIVRTTPNKHYRQGISSPTELADGFPTSAAELFAYDAVIIGSYEAATLNREQHRLLKEFVDRRGGAVLMLAGRYGLSAGGWQHASIAQTLPATLPARQENGFVQRPARAQPTVYGSESPIARLDMDDARNAERWKAMPELADHQSLGRLKPGAVVLLEAVDEGGRDPLLVWQHYGRGATYLLGTASTLRWQMHLPPEDQSHEMFWRQLLHAVAGGAPARVSINGERTVYDDEQRVRLEAEVRDENFEPVNAAQVEVLVAPEREPAFTQAMQASGDNDGRYLASIDAPGTGLYRIDMKARDAQDKQIGTAVTHVLRSDGIAEHFATRQHRAVLERIAAMTGGRYWTLDQLDDLVAAMPYSRAGVVERRTLELWNIPALFLLLLVLKLGEWLLRLKWGRL